MFNVNSRRMIVLLTFTIAVCCLSSAQQGKKDVMVNGKLVPGFDMGANTSENKTNLIKVGSDHLKLLYPSDQSWGAVFVTVGKPKQPPRPFQDFSGFNTLSIEMKGGIGGEQIEVGVKSNTQPDDGSENKKRVTLTSEWRTYTFPLDKFETDLDKLYVVGEIVFSGGDAMSVFVRNISYTNVPK